MTDQNLQTNPFPAALHDALLSYQWVLKNAAKFGGDPTRVAVAWENAGSNLAAEITLHAKAEGFTMPRAQLLVYPVTDFSVAYPSDLRESGTAIPQRSITLRISTCLMPC